LNKFKISEKRLQCKDFCCLSITAQKGEKIVITMGKEGRKVQWRSRYIFELISFLIIIILFAAEAEAEEKRKQSCRESERLSKRSC
jgi:hypothetical protein